jgi:hypothetical protein
LVRDADTVVEQGRAAGLLHPLTLGPLVGHSGGPHLGPFVYWSQRSDVGEQVGAAAGIDQTPHWLAGDLGDQVVVAVDVHEAESHGPFDKIFQGGGEAGYGESAQPGTCSFRHEKRRIMSGEQLF